MTSQTIDFNGKRIVVVEDDYLLATDICRELRSLGATVLGPAPTPFYALQLIGHKDRRRIHAAILDVHLHGTTVYDLADTLHERGVPILFATGFGRTAIPKRFEGALVLDKPVSSEKLVEHVSTLLSRPKSQLPPPVSVERAPISSEPPVVHFARALARSWL